MKKIKSFGPVLIILAAVLWSLDGLLRRSLYVLPPIVVVFYEHLAGFLLLLPFLIRSFRQPGKINLKIWGAFLWVTILSSILGTVFYTAALGKVNYIQFSVVVLLQQLQPLFVILFARLILKERIEKIFWPLLILALAGAYLVSFPQLTINLATGGETITAALLAVGAAFSWGSSTAFSRYALLKLPALTVTGLRFGLATILGLVAVFLLGQQKALFILNQAQLKTLLLIALSTGMVALFIYYKGLKRTPARISSICEFAWPLSAIFIDYFLFHKTLTATQWLGAGLLSFIIVKVSGMPKKIV